MIRLCLLSLCLASPAFGQIIEGDSSVIRIGPSDVTRETRLPVSSAAEAVLRGLDKTTGTSTNLFVTLDEPFRFGSLNLTMHDCRYPKGNPSGDAYVNLSIQARGIEAPIFDGWMVASSPALMALDHPRYDIWAIRCKLPQQRLTGADAEISPIPTMRPEGLRGNVLE